MEKGPKRVDSDAPGARLADAWDRLCATLRDARELVLGAEETRDERWQAEGFRYLTRLLAAGTTVCMEHADPDEPAFGRMMDHTMKWGLDAPDCLYLYASIGRDRCYRIHGHRGSANHLDIQINYGHFCEGDISAWGTSASISGDELELEADGSFELWLGGKQRSTNYLPLAENAEFVLVRQYFDDWDRERPADLSIERVGGEIAAVSPTPVQVEARLERLSRWIARGGALWQAMSRGFLALPPNSLVVHRGDASDARAGMKGQVYCLGNFSCAADQAVVLEFELPPCRHLSIGLANGFWESLDYACRQTSLNRHQATVDADGLLRVVIAHRDPGVPNWLDTTGLERGTLAVRLLGAATVPEPRLRAVPWTDLRRYLPAGTASVGPDERRRVLERRRAAVERRFRR